MRLFPCLLLLALARLAPAAPYQLPTSVEGFRAELRRPDLPDTLRVICLNNLSRFAQASDLAAARAYVAQALALARRVGYCRGEANALLMQGSIATVGHDALTSQTSTLQALAVFRQLGNRKGMASAWQALGTVAVLVGDHSRALRHYRQADSTFRRLTPPCLWCELNVQSNIAAQYTELSRYAEAERVFRQVLARTEGQDDSFAQMRVAALIGVAEQQARAGRPDSAVLGLRQGLAIARRLDDQYEQTVLLNTLTDLYGPTALADPRRQEAYARQAVALGWASGQQQPLQKALGNLAAILQQQGNPAAYDTLGSYVRLSQQLQAAERTQALADAQTRYDVDGQRATIRDLQKDRRLAAQNQELARLRGQRQLLALGGGTGLLLLLGGGLFGQYRRRQAAAAATATATLRQSLAADLHDDVGNLLTQISMHSSLLRETPHTPAQTVVRLDAMAAASRQAAQQMSDVVWGLDTRHLCLSQLLDRMRDHAQEVLPPAGLDVRFEVPAPLPDPALPADLAHHFYLIYKEALHNVVKHAQATAVTVRLAVASPPGLTLTVADNGRGHNGKGRANGRGLANMEARAQAAGGTVCYEGLAAGFSVVVSLPLA